MALFTWRDGGQKILSRNQDVRQIPATNESLYLLLTTMLPFTLFNVCFQQFALPCRQDPHANKQQTHASIMPNATQMCVFVTNSL